MRTDRWRSGRRLLPVMSATRCRPAPLAMSITSAIRRNSSSLSPRTKITASPRTWKTCANRSGSRATSLCSPLRNIAPSLPTVMTMSSCRALLPFLSRRWLRQERAQSRRPQWSDHHENDDQHEKHVDHRGHIDLRCLLSSSGAAHCHKRSSADSTPGFPAKFPRPPLRPRPTVVD